MHRDLKLANVKLGRDGGVKILDFGLAKAYEGDSAIPSGGGLSQSPTMTAQMTEAGIILGTAGYMAPEQARGKAVDKRADIWSFGVLLFEMLTGKRLFDGETVSDVVAALLTREPDWSALPATTPVACVQLLRRCLERDPKQRLRDIGEARVALESAKTAEPAPAPARVSRSPAIATRTAPLLLRVDSGWLRRGPVRSRGGPGRNALSRRPPSALHTLVRRSGGPKVRGRPFGRSLPDDGPQGRRLARSPGAGPELVR